MRVLLITLLTVGAASLAHAQPTDELGPTGSSKCVVLYNDAFRYDSDLAPQQAKDASLWKRVIVAVCWWKGQEYYVIRTGEHVFREYYDGKGKLVREGVGEWSFAPRVYLGKSIADDVKPWEGGGAVMTDSTPFDEPYKEE